ncbi:MAG TPA: TolC family protein [Anaeromyxobacteraceae bacterium]|nr:TolC family protein [Anaeromyxobacteraceae bacterium]
MTLAPALLLAALAGAPLTLDDALAEAARASGDVALARAQLAEAGIDASEAWAGVLPRLDLTVSAGHLWTGEQRTAPSFGLPAFVGPPADSAQYDGRLDLQLPIFDGGRNWNGIRRSAASERAAARALDETRLGVGFETLRRFYELVKAQESLRVLEATVARSEEFVRRTEALFEAGRGSRADVLSAAGNLGTDRIAVEQGRARLAAAQADLATALGRDRSEDLEAVPPPAALGETAPATAPPEPELLALARRSRPLLATRGEEIRAAELSQVVARGAWFPSFAARGAYDRQSFSFGGDYGLVGQPQKQYAATAALVLSWNLYEGGRTRGEEQRAAVATTRARVQAAQADTQVAAEISRARANLIALGRAAAIAADNLATAEQGVRLARDRLDAGVATQLEVRDASLKLTQAQLTLVQTRIDRVVARADLSRAVGGVL